MQPKMMDSGRITANPEITPKMEFCPDWRRSRRIGLMYSSDFCSERELLSGLEGSKHSRLRRADEGIFSFQ
jgi:hypothetical protein